MPELLEILAAPKSLAVAFDQEERDALGAGLGVGLGGQHQQIAELAVGDEDLLAIDHVIVAITDGARADGLQIAAGMGLGHAERADGLAADHLRQPLLLLRLGAEGKDVGRNQIRVDEKAGTAGADAPQFLEHDHIEQIVQAEAAVFFRHRATQQAFRAGLEPQVTRDDPVLLPLRMERNDFAFHEAAHRLPEYVVFLPEQGARDHRRGYSVNLWKSGARFSLKALTPSFDSGVA